MPPTTVEPKSALDANQRAWLKKMGAALQVNLSGSSAQGTATQQPQQAAGASPNTELQLKCKKIKDTVEPRIKDALAADPSKKDEIDRLLATAAEHEAGSLFDDAFSVLTSLVETVKSALGVVADNVKYELSLREAEPKIEALKKHAQYPAIAAQFAKLEGYLKQAKAHAQNGKYDKANEELKKLHTEHATVKKLADDIQQERKFEASLLIRFNNLKDHQGKENIETQLKDLKGLFVDLDVAIKAQDLGAARIIRVGADNKGGISGKLQTFKQLANRHGDYVGLRKNAELQVQTLEAHPNKDAITSEIAAIKKVIDEAKTQYETNKRYEKARDELFKVEKLYTDAKKKADDQSQLAFKKERDALQLKVKELEKPQKTNPIVAGEVAAIKAKLAKADKYAGAKQYPDAMKLVEEAKKDCAEAEKSSAQQAAFAAANKAAGDSTRDIAKDSKAAVDVVQKLHDELKKHPQEPVIRFELGQVQSTIQQAKAALA